MSRMLGHGTDGAVWQSTSNTAVKVLELLRNYNIELECYQRLESEGVNHLKGFAVPQLLGFNRELLVIEMRIVTPPFILDFAKAWLDVPPDFSPEVLEDWERDGWSVSKPTGQRSSRCWQIWSVTASTTTVPSPRTSGSTSELRRFGDGAKRLSFRPHVGDARAARPALGPGRQPNGRRTAGHATPLAS